MLSKTMRKPERGREKEQLEGKGKKKEREQGDKSKKLVCANAIWKAVFNWNTMFFGGYV